MRDPEADGWECSDFLIICKTCIGDNPFVRMELSGILLLVIISAFLLSSNEHLLKFCFMNFSFRNVDQSSIQLGMQDMQSTVYNFRWKPVRNARFKETEAWTDLGLRSSHICFNFQVGWLVQRKSINYLVCNLCYFF